MEIIEGKRSTEVAATALAARLSRYHDVWIDLGTGDGRFVRQLAAAHPRRLVIGVDACRENLRATSRRVPPNAMFVIANALALPSELAGVAHQVTINFPWGTLLTGLLSAAPALLQGLQAIAQPAATFELRLNGGALAEAGWSLEDGGARVRQVLRESGFAAGPPAYLDAAALRTIPTSWARRLAFGRDPRALYLPARFPTGMTVGSTASAHSRAGTMI